MKTSCQTILLSERRAWIDYRTHTKIIHHHHHHPKKSSRRRQTDMTKSTLLGASPPGRGLRPKTKNPKRGLWLNLGPSYPFSKPLPLTAHRSPHHTPLYVRLCAYLLGWRHTHRILYRQAMTSDHFIPFYTGSYSNCYNSWPHDQSDGMG